MRRIAVEAGELILEYFDGIRDNETTGKSDGSPVTIADQQAEALIETNLTKLLPGIPFIGEESYASGTRVDLTNQPYFWLVDPLDGTKSFLRGEGEFTVNIGLIHNGSPVLGVVYAPEKGELYAGFTEENGNASAFRYFEDSEKEKEMRTRKMLKQGLTVTSGGHYGRKEEFHALLENFKVSSIIRQSSSLKLCAIANAKADLYPRFGAICEWDTAAGHAILRAAGGDIRDFQGKTIKYCGQNEGMLLPDFLAASMDFFETYESALNSGE